MRTENTSDAGRLTVNRAILTIAAVFGAVFGIGGMGHGFFEALQGSTPTGGLMIEAIGEAQRMWAHGNEPAFTVLPNFLISGIAAMLVGAAVIVWSVGFMRRKHAPLIFLLLFILLFAVGGGVAQVIFFLMIWGMATRIHKPLHWWRQAIPAGARRCLARLWLPFLVISAALILYTLQVAIFGFVPGLNDPDAVSMAMVSTLGAGLLFMLLAFIAGCAHDIEKGGDINE